MYPTDQNVHALHQRFLAVLPRIEARCRAAFRQVRCSHQQADLVQECVALAWKWFRRCEERGKDPTRFTRAIATFAVIQVRSGRKLARCDSPRDVLSPRARRRHRFTVASLLPSGALADDPLSHALHSNTQTPVADQAAFRIDFRAWFCALPPAKWRLLLGLMLGERTTDIARKHGLSPARVSQVRRQAVESWRAFTAS